MSDSSLRRALYILFGRLLAGELSPELYRRLREGGLDQLARAQGVDLVSDLLGPDDMESACVELAAEHARLAERVSLLASDYSEATDDAVVALDAFLREHELTLLEGVDLPHDHVSVVLGMMGELAQREEQAGPDADEAAHARAFFLRHLHSWAPRALTEISAHADRRFYRGVASMLSAFLASERQRYS